MASADVLQPGQLLPLQVVVEVAGLVGEGEVDPQRVFEDLEAGAPGADAEPAKLGAILEITDARPADGPLAEVHLVGLHLAGDDKRWLLGVVGLLFVAGGDEFSQPLLDRRDPFLCGAPGLLLASFCPACFLRAALLLAARGRDGAGRRRPGRRSLLGRPQVVDLPLQAFQFAGHALGQVGSRGGELDDGRLLLGGEDNLLGRLWSSRLQRTAVTRFGSGREQDRQAETA